MDISEEEIKSAKDGVVIAKGAPWLYYVIRYSKHDNQYIFYEKDEGVNIITIIYTTKNLDDMITAVNNYFNKQFLTLKVIENGR